MKYQDRTEIFKMLLKVLKNQMEFMLGGEVNHSQQILLLCKF